MAHHKWNRIMDVEEDGTYSLLKVGNPYFNNPKGKGRISSFKECWLLLLDYVLKNYKFKWFWTINQYKPAFLKHKKSYRSWNVEKSLLTLKIRRNACHSPTIWKPLPSVLQLITRKTLCTFNWQVMLIRSRPSKMCATHSTFMISMMSWISPAF